MAPTDELQCLCEVSRPDYAGMVLKEVIEVDLVQDHDHLNITSERSSDLDG